jgi:hypothetical protein
MQNLATPQPSKSNWHITPLQNAAAYHLFLSADVNVSNSLQHCERGMVERTPFVFCHRNPILQQRLRHANPNKATIVTSANIPIPTTNLLYANSQQTTTSYFHKRNL